MSMFCWPRGAQILDELFPGFLNELVADGAPVWDDGELSKLHLSFGGHEILRSGKIAPEPRRWRCTCRAGRFWNAMSGSAYGR